MKFLSPPYLKKNDLIAIVATARKVTVNEMKAATDLFYSWGLKVINGQYLYGECNQFSGSDEQRAADLQFALDHKDIRAICIARGGYGTLRIIDNLDFSKFKKNPKWICGFSDITVLHSHINSMLNIETLHAMMPVNILSGKNNELAILSLKSALFGKKISYEIAPHPLNIRGNAEAVIVGGNLSLLYAMKGSVSDLNTNGCILFIEDLDEYLYHIDRMMLSLKRCGKLSKLAGLIVGAMTEMKDNAVPFGKTAFEIIAESVSEYNYPVCFGFPAGHMDDNRTLILGRKVKMLVDNNKVTVEFSER